MAAEHQHQHQNQRRHDRLILALRLVGAVGGAAVFGLVAAGMLPPWRMTVAIGLGFCFGVAFVGGTGYRILIAVALRDPNRSTAASWTGASAFAALAALGGYGAARLAGLEADWVLAGFGLAINAAYLPVKLACLLAGCCRAVHPAAIRMLADGRADLRLVEVGWTGAVAAAGLLAAATGSAGVAAVIGLGGHLADRLGSRWARQRLPDARFSGGRGMELPPLAALVALAVIALL